MNGKMAFVCCSTMMCAVWLAASGCDPVVGGPCVYQDTVGTATIVSVAEADAEGYNCANDPVEVVFDFVPDEAAAADLAETGLRLTISAGANPPADWVDAEGLTEGTQHPCVRRDIITGTCTPTLYEFSEVDYAAGADACW